MTPTSLSAETSPPVLARAADVPTLGGDRQSAITLLADSADTQGALTANRTLLRVGSDGAPPHFHTRCHELFFVLGGALDVLLGEEVVTLHAGDCLVVPPRVPHAFAPPGGKTADVLVVFTPGMDRFDYYRLLDRVARGEAAPGEIAASQDRFDNHYVESPRWREARAPRSASTR